MLISRDSTRDLSDKDLTLMAQCHGQKTTGRSSDFWRHTNDSTFESNLQTQGDEQIDTIRTNTSYMLQTYDDFWHEQIMNLDMNMSDVM